MNYRDIMTITRYEMKLISRNWTFRFLVVFIICVVTIFHLFCHSQWRTVKTMIELPACIPYVNAFIYNILQAISVIFLAGGFIYRDQLRKTNDALSVRSFSNREYVLGKMLAMIGCFVVVNMVVLTIGILIHCFASESSLVLSYYWFYLFTLSLPSLVFLVSLSTAFRLFFKSHVLPVLLLLCFLFWDIIVLSSFAHGVLDFTAMRVPNFFSTLTGHPALGSYFVQRAVFLCLGGGCIVCSIPFMKRIPNDTRDRVRVVGCGMLFFSGALLLGFTYLYPFHRVEMNRARYIATSKKFESCLKVSVLNHEIIYTPGKNGYVATSKMSIKNGHAKALDTLLFYLNPGLQVKKAWVQGIICEVWRENQVVGVKHSLAVGDSVTLILDYGGTIDEAVAYLDVDKRAYYKQELEHLFFCYGNRYAFINENFILLTPECLWYPVALSPVNLEQPSLTRREFSDYILKFAHPGSLSVISQGMPEERGDTICFMNTRRVFGITLVAGHFTRDSVQSPGWVSLEFYNQKHHYPWNGVLATSRGIKERGCQLLKSNSFPFTRLAFVEVPVSFYTFERSWRNETGYVQPEIVFQPEWGGNAVDYQKLLEKRQGYDAGVNMESLVKNRISDQYRGMTSPDKSLDPLVKIFFPGKKKSNKHYFSALSDRHSIFVYSDEFPDIDGILADMKKDLVAENSFYVLGNISRRALNCLGNTSIGDIMESGREPALIKEARRLKGGHLWRDFSTSITWDSLLSFIQDFHERYRDRSVSFECFAKDFHEALGIDPVPVVRELYSARGIARFWLRDVKIEGATVEEKPRLMSFKVWNRGVTSGVVSVVHRSAERLRILECWKIEANECRKINYYVSGEMAAVTLNLGLSANNPPTCFPVTHLPKDIEDWEMNILADTALFKSPDEIIVDDEDPGFLIVEKKNRWLPGKTWEEREVRQQDQYMPEGWCYTMRGGYGEVLKRQCMKGAGRGESRVEWNARIEEEGTYQLFIYNFASSVVNYNLCSHNYIFSHGTREEKITLSFSGCPKYDEPNARVRYSYTPEIEVKINYADGNTESFIPSSYVNWIPAGTYALPKGEVKLVLYTSGVSPGELYCADAVKWVKVTKKD